MSKQKKPFFLKRWIESLCGWLDKVVFPSVPDRAGAVAVPFWWSLLVSFAFGLAGAIRTLFKGNPDTFIHVVIILALVVVAAFVIPFLVKDLPFFDSTGKKIGRAVFVLAICGIAFFVGFYLANLVMILAIIALALWIVKEVVFGSSSGAKKKIRLDNGDELTVEKGVVGEEYYTSSSGKEYERVSGNTFQEKE